MANETNKPADAPKPAETKSDAQKEAAVASSEPVDSKGNKAADPDTAFPGSVRSVNSEVTNSDGETIEVVTRVNASPQQANMGAVPGDQNDPGEQTEELFQSSGEPVPSVVIKRFYDDVGALVREGANYTYLPKKGLPYPWPLMRPVDDKNADSLKKQYDSFMAEKNKMLEERSNDRRLLDRLRGV